MKVKVSPKKVVEIQNEAQAFWNSNERPEDEESALNLLTIKVIEKVEEISFSVTSK